MKSIFIAFTVVSSVVTLFGQTIDLRGVVRNQAKVPVKGLEIILLKAGLVDTTDSSGRFEFKQSGTVAIPRPDIFDSPPRIENGRLIFSVKEKRQNVSAGIFNLQGARVIEIVDKELDVGEYRIPLGQTIRGGKSSSMLILVFKTGNMTARFQLLNIGARYRINAIEKKIAGGAAGERYSASSDIADTLIIERKDTVELRMALSSYRDSLSIMLDLIPWEVIELALKEVNNGPDMVGKSLNRYPYALGNYLAPNEAWCSEFVAWVYRAADYPFTGGTEGGWMLRSSESIKQWFQKNSRFVSHTDADWESFKPSPGDYIRYAYEQAGGHSGIVRYADGSTLYTIEGNVNNKVMLRTIKNYKNFSQNQIDGIGMRSGYLKKQS